jgi:hypothetical protein
MVYQVLAGTWRARPLVMDVVSPDTLARVTGGVIGAGLVGKLGSLNKLWFAEPWKLAPGEKPLWRETLEAIGAYDKNVHRRVMRTKAKLQRLSGQEFP